MCPAAPRRTACVAPVLGFLPNPSLAMDDRQNSRQALLIPGPPCPSPQSQPALRVCFCPLSQKQAAEARRSTSGVPSCKWVKPPRPACPGPHPPELPVPYGHPPFPAARRISLSCWARRERPPRQLVHSWRGLCRPRSPGPPSMRLRKLLSGASPAFSPGPS